MPTKAILFDIDNTLIDFWKMKTLSVEAAVSAMIDAGLKVNRKKALKDIYSIYDKKGVEYQKIFDDFLKKTIKRIDYRILSAGIQAYREVKETFLDPYPHTLPTLITLIKRGYRLGIVSNAPVLQAWTRLQGMRIAPFFDVVVSAEETGTLKPDPKVLLLGAKRLGLKPKDIAFVGDSLDLDVAGAKAAGMITVLAKYGKGWPDKKKIKPDYVINDIAELLKIFK